MVAVRDNQWLVIYKAELQINCEEWRKRCKYQCFLYIFALLLSDFRIEISIRV